VAVGDFVAEPLGVGLNRIAVNLKTVLVLENPFHGCERILRGMKQEGVIERLARCSVSSRELRYCRG
jgi:hypothetical protein